MYKLMLCDLDETLLVNHHVPDYNQEAIRKGQEKGLKFVVATGRANYMIDTILKEIGTYDLENEYSICFNGALIVENKNNKVLFYQGIDFDSTNEIFKRAKDYGLCVLIFTTNKCYIHYPSASEVQRKKDQGCPFEVKEGDIDYLKDEKIVKILFQGDNMDYLKKVEKEMRDITAGKINASFSSNRYIEFNALGIDKGFGLKWLAKYLNIDIQDTIAMGDNYNDEAMIKVAGLGVLVSCATDDLKALGDYVTTANYDEGAVKEVIEKFILEDK